MRPPQLAASFVSGYDLSTGQCPNSLPRVSKQNGLSAWHLRPLETTRRALGKM